MLDISGPVEIEVESFAGDIRVIGDPGMEKARVRVVRQGVHGIGRREDAERSLEDIMVNIELVPGEIGQKLRVIATTDNLEPQFLRAHIFVAVPEVDGVSIRSNMGDISALGVAGPLDFKGSGGDVKVQTNRPLRRPVTIINNGGDIEYRVRGESTAKFDCEAVNGVVSPWIRFGHFQIDPHSSDRILKGVLNDGDNRVFLRTVDGDIRISVIHNPELVHGFHFDW